MRSDEFSLIDAAAAEPQRLALITDDARFTYAELAQRTLHLLAQWRSDGTLAAASAIPWLAQRRIESVLTFYAALQAGLPIVPLHPRTASQDQQSLLQQARTYVDHGGSALAIVQTSGSTGKPKAVVLSRRAFAAAVHMHAAHLPWQAEDRWLACMPLAHVGGLGILLRCLQARRTVVLAPQLSFDARRIRRILAAQQVTLLSAVPTMLAQLADQPAPASLRAVLVGGAAASPALLTRARAGGWPILASYGLSETCGQICTQSPNQRELDGNVGRPLPGVRLSFDDGKICISTPTRMDGYLDDAGRLIRDGNEWLATQDLGALDAHGQLHLRGRADAMILSGGENVDPLAVEAILRNFDGVEDACVVGLPDALWGQTVAAALVLTKHADDAAWQRILQRCRMLPAHQRPRRFLRLQEMPTLPSGKVDRRQVQQAFE